MEHALLNNFQNNLVETMKYFSFRNPYEERTAHAYHVYSGTGNGNWGYSGMVS